MTMTPDEYRAKEFNVPGWDEDEPVYAPGPETDPNIRAVLRDEDPSPSPVPQLDPELVAITHEYNFTLPLELRRAELSTETAKQLHLAARTNLWNTLSLAVVLTPILAFIAVLVK